jgi:hypothetical protein
MNFLKEVLYPKQGVGATRYLFGQLCIRLIPLLIQGVNAVILVVRVEWVY